MPDSLLAMARTGDGLAAPVGSGDSLVALSGLGDGFLAGVGCTNSLVARVRSRGSLVHRACGDSLAARVRSCPAGAGIAVMLLVKPVGRRIPVLSMVVLIFVFGFVLLSVAILVLALIFEDRRSVLRFGDRRCTQRKNKAQKEQKSYSMHMRTPKLDFLKVTSDGLEIMRLVSLNPLVSEVQG